MNVECDDCGNGTFENMRHDYYGQAWFFECAECGASVQVHEHVEA